MKVIEELKKKWPEWKKQAAYWMIQTGAKSLDKKHFNKLFKNLFEIWKNPPMNRWGVREWEDPILVNENEEVEHPCYVDSLAKQYIAASNERRKKRAASFVPTFKQGDLVAAQLHYWGWGSKKKDLWGGDQIEPSGPEAVGTVCHYSPAYLAIEWSPKDGDTIDRRDVSWGDEDKEVSRIGYRNYTKYYTQIRREKKIEKDVYMYDFTGWREKEDMEYDYSAVDGKGKKIWFRKIEVDKCVRDWAQRSKLDARFF